MSIPLLRIPVSNDGKTVRSIEVLAGFPLSPDEWDAFIRILEAMKPGFVYPDPEPAEGRECKEASIWIG